MIFLYEIYEIFQTRPKVSKKELSYIQAIIFQIQIQVTSFVKEDHEKLSNLIAHPKSRYLVLLKICIFDFHSSLSEDYIFRYKSLELFEYLSQMATINYDVF